VRLNKPPLPVAYGVANSPLGYFLAVWQGEMLVRLHLMPAHTEKEAAKFLKDWGWDSNIKADPKRAEKLIGQLFTKNRWTGVFPASLSLGFYGTDFQWAAMQKMLKVPAGKTTTYAGLATAANANGASRAAGSVCSRNPLPFVVPCHRILATNGGLGNYGFGTALKRQLLDW